MNFGKTFEEKIVCKAVTTKITLLRLLCQNPRLSNTCLETNANPQPVTIGGYDSYSRGSVPHSYVCVVLMGT